MQIYSKSQKKASSPSFFDRFWFGLLYIVELTLVHYTSTQNFENCSPVINYGNFMQIYSKNNKNCFFSLISWPILIWFALSGRAKFGTLNFYTELWDFAPLIIYGT